MFRCHGLFGDAVFGKRGDVNRMIRGEQGESGHLRTPLTSGIRDVHAND